MNKFLLLLLFVFVSCGRDVRDSEETGLLDLDMALSAPSSVSLSTIASGIDYVLLETSDSCLLSRFHTPAYISEKYILMSSRFDIPYLFDGKGKFLCKIGRKGYGPGEMQNGGSIAWVDEDNGVIAVYQDRLHDRKSVMYFDMQGRYIRDESFAVDSSDTLVREYYWGGTSDYHVLIDRQLDSTRVYIRDTAGGFCRVPGQYLTDYLPVELLDDAHAHSPRYIFSPPLVWYSKDHFTYYDNQADRYYRMTRNGEVSCRYMVKRKSLAKADRNSYLNLYETEHHIIILTGGALNSGSMPQSLRFVYMKETDKLICLPQNELLQNDLDSGIPFWPWGATQDGRLYSCLPALWLKEQLAALEAPAAEIKRLQEQIAEDSNQVLVFVTLK